MSALGTLRTRESPALMCAAIGTLLLGGLMAWDHSPRTLSSYLFAWLFFLGLSLGSLGALMMHQLTGGRWSAPVHRYFEAALAPLPLLALLFVPVALGMGRLFPWANGCCGGGESSRFDAAYLTRGAFLLRSGFALVVWCVMGHLWRTRIALRRRSTALSAAGLLVYTVTMSWASVDWIASLEPHWSSSVLGLLVVTGQALSAFALATLCATRASGKSNAPDAGECGDLGNLLLTFVMSWMYLAFVQFLIIWAEDLPRETSWFLPRLEGPWGRLTLLVVAAGFGLPFVLLLFRRLKCDVLWLGRIALLLLVTHWLYVAWLVLPTTQPAGALLSASDLAATIAVGGFWCFAFLRALGTRVGDATGAEPPRRLAHGASASEQTHGS